jgi:NADPH:quinone reductase-like Zn-dependent oxidoreductase
MQALLLSGAGFEHYALANCAIPTPGPGDVLLRMRAASITLRDYKVVSGAYAAAEQTRPLVTGGEGVGEIEALGMGVTGWRIGARVHPLFMQGWLSGRPHPSLIAGNALGGPRLQGCHGEYLVVRADSIVAVPTHLSDVEAATLPFAGLAAWRAVVEQGAIRAGEVVMIQGTGGIPLLALQFAKALGARVIVSSKSDDKLQRARELGADQVINYAQTPEWSQVVLEMTEGLGADLVLDPGGTVTLAQSIRAVRPGGAISVFNALGSADIGLHLPYLLGHNIAVHGVNAGSLASHAAMLKTVADIGLRPVIERTVSLQEGVAAVAAAPKAEQFGKVCLQF